MIEIEEPQTDQKVKIIFNPYVKTATQVRSKVMRIEQEDELTRIDFVYYPPKHYVNGGWVQIDPGSFIRPCNTKERYTLVKALNIPYAPNKYHFKSVNEVLYYTLYFPRLPQGIDSIDIIEKEAPGTYFNFYGVSLEKAMMERLPVSN